MQETCDNKVLITGGAGFIGQSIAKKFKEAGCTPCLYDIGTPSSKLGNHVKGDIFDFDLLKDVVDKHDIIIHLVGLADAGVAQKDPMKSFKLNIESLNNVLEACRITRNRKKLIFPSSAGVYGQPEILPIRENFEAKPMGIYSWHKYICEKMIRGYHENYGLEYVILRLFNVYGRGNKGVIDVFLKMAKRGETIKSFGPYQYRDFIYANDVAEAFFKSAMYEKANNRIINIGSGKGVQIKDILDLACEMYPNAKWVQERKEFPMYDSIADITLASILLDFKPHASMEFMKKVVREEMMSDL